MIRGPSAALRAAHAVTSAALRRRPEPHLHPDSRPLRCAPGHSCRHLRRAPDRSWHYLTVAHADLPGQARRDLPVVGDDHDGGAGRRAARAAAPPPRPPTPESRLPVGSSASSSGGSPTTARAIATRCRSPPDSSCGRWSSRWPRPTRSSAASARRRRSRAATPGVEQAVGHVVQRAGRRRRGGTAGRRTRSGVARSADSSAVGQRGHVVPVDVDGARRRPVERADQVQHGRLARAGRADDRDQLARARSTATRRRSAATPSPGRC